MKVIYRTSDTGYSKIKPEYVNSETCLRNAIKEFKQANWKLIADNVSADTESLIRKCGYIGLIDHVQIGHGAGTFNLALDYALTLSDDEVVYFLENDYLHRPNSYSILMEGFELGASFVSLYDHPDKYLDGANPYVYNGGEETKVFLSDSCHWKLTNSTTMTFASKVSTLREYEPTLRKYTSTSHPHDFEMWIDLRNQGASLITPLPGYSTHGESAWLTPLINWNNVNSNT